MKLLVACIFGITLMSASTSAQRPDCSFIQISDWAQANLSPACVNDLFIFNTSWNTAVGMTGLDRTCTDDSCGGALYRYLLANCSNTQSFVQQQRCATNGTLRCFYGEWPTAYPTFFNSTAFTDLFTTCSQANLTNPCPEGCAEALMTIRGNIGCCFNNYYNASIPNPWQDLLPFASYQLWAACQVPTLGRCPEILDPNAPTMMPTTAPSMIPTTAGSDAIAASVLFLLILATMNVFFVL